MAGARACTPSSSSSVSRLAILAVAWLRAPRRRHAVILFVLVLAGVFTHVSMFLVGAGLLPARRTASRSAKRGAGGARSWAPARGGPSLWGPRFSCSPAAVTPTGFRAPHRRASSTRSAEPGDQRNPHRHALVCSWSSGLAAVLLVRSDRRLVLTVWARVSRSR